MSSNFDAILMQGDAVYYSGDNERLKTELTSKDGKPFRGWIHAPVVNEPGVWIVEFPDSKNFDSYILAGRNLTKARPAKDAGPEVQPRRTRKKEDE